MATTSGGKDTIYIDIDDEITAVIEKVRASNEKIVALVLPKRASVLQSIVNMKLLKRSADNAKKHIVLITSEAGLLPLAGAVGFHVAKNLQTKPEIPAAPGAETDEVIDEEPLEGPEADPTDSEITAATAGNRPIGELAAAGGATTAGDEAIETVDMDDDGEDTAPAAAAAGAKPPQKNKKLAVPSFDKFRLRLVLGAVALVLLIVLFYICNSVLPKATITLTTDTSDVNTSLTLSLDTGVKTLDPNTATIPASLQKVDKSGSQQVATTGKKNNGTPATGSVSMSACVASFSSFPDPVPAGTGVTYNGLTYITQEDTKFSHSGTPSGTCISYQATNDTTIDAQTGGANYNVSSVPFKVAGRSDVSATGSASGGTDNIVQVVSQADIDSATQKIAGQNTNSVKSQLQTQIKQAGLYPITSTFKAGDPTITTSSNVGDQASTLTVTEVTTYAMFGVKQADLKTLIDNDVKKHIDASKQSILDEGLSKATFHVNNQTDTLAQVALTTSATAGPDLKVASIKSQSAGKKSGDVKSALKNDPGVSAVDVKLSPFWVSHIPSKTSKITVIFQKAGQ